MACRADTGSESDAPARLSSSSEWRAVQMLRRVALEGRSTAPTSSDAQPANLVDADMARAGVAFRSFQAVAQWSEGVREPRLAGLDSQSLTKDERRLMRALAAAQAGDEVILDNRLYKLALAPLPRARLAESVRAKALAVRRQQRPAMATRQPVPATARQRRSALRLPEASAMNRSALLAAATTGRECCGDPVTHPRA